MLSKLKEMLCNNEVQGSNKTTTQYHFVNFDPAPGPASTQNFHEVAYFADDRQDLLNGINEFLDCSIVLPPSDVAGKDLLKTVAGFQKEMMRKRKERVLKKQQSFCLGPEQVHKGTSSSPSPRGWSRPFSLGLDQVQIGSSSFSQRVEQVHKETTSYPPGIWTWTK